MIVVRMGSGGLVNGWMEVVVEVERVWGGEREGGDEQVERKMGFK